VGDKVQRTNLLAVEALNSLRTSRLFRRRHRPGRSGQRWAHSSQGFCTPKVTAVCGQPRKGSIHPKLRCTAAMLKGPQNEKVFFAGPPLHSHILRHQSEWHSLAILPTRAATNLVSFRGGGRKIYGGWPGANYAAASSRHEWRVPERGQRQHSTAILRSVAYNRAR